nr:alpha/beta hydrolases superfamily protein [Tanacetum cinerariifolium]
CYRCGDPSHFIGECPKPPRNKEQKAFVEGSWSDSENDDEEKTNEETCLIAQSSNEVTLDSSYFSDNASSLETQVKFVKFDQSANSLNEILIAQRSPSSKGGLGFDKNEALTSGTKQVRFV